jgi:tetratricopeptide (TPR) repeat protein
MFFPKLRRRAKWVFLALAIAFAGGFLFFGVGAGGSGIGDYFSDLFNRQPTAGGGPSLEEARERAAKNPADADAQLELATALQAEGRTEEAIVALERYTALKPRDPEVMRTLAALYGSVANEALTRAQRLEGEAQAASIQSQFAPQDSPFAQALTQDQITGALSAQASEQAQEARTRGQRYASLQTSVYERLTGLVRDDPLLFLQYGQAAETAGEYETALTAYRRFLELAPDDPTAEQVKSRIDLLKPLAEGSG